MTAVTTELIYEVLKAMQARFSNLEEGQREIRGELKGVRATLDAQQMQLVAVRGDIGNLYEAFGAIESRLTRIERRLDIIDVPAS